MIWADFLDIHENEKSINQNGITWNFYFWNSKSDLWQKFEISATFNLKKLVFWDFEDKNKAAT